MLARWMMVVVLMLMLREMKWGGRLPGPCLLCRWWEGRTGGLVVVVRNASNCEDEGMDECRMHLQIQGMHVGIEFECKRACSRFYHPAHASEKEIASSTSSVWYVAYSWFFSDRVDTSLLSSRLLCTRLRRRLSMDVRIWQCTSRLTIQDHLPYIHIFSPIYLSIESDTHGIKQRPIQSIHVRSPNTTNIKGHLLAC